MDNKNLITAMILFGVIMLATQFFFPPVEKSNNVEIATSDKIESSEHVINNQPINTDPVISPPVTSITNNSNDISKDVLPVNVTLTNDLFDVSFDSYGGGIKNILLHNYRVNNTPESDNFSIISTERNAESILRLTGTGNFSFDEKSIFKTENKKNIITKDTTKIIYSYQLHNGANIIKEYIFTKASYEIDMNIYIQNNSEESLSGSLSLLLPSKVLEEETASAFEFSGPITLVGEDLKKDSADDLEDGSKEYSSGVLWTGYLDKFFMGAIIPNSDSVDSVSISLAGDVTTNVIHSPTLNIIPGSSAKLSYVGYFGPKDIDIITEINPTLSNAVDFGFFSFLALPLFHALKYFYSILGNYGLAIILLTIIIKLIFWPLTHKSYSSMKSMQKLGPEMQKLREKYKDDKTRMNQEVMGLYKEHRVNPLGGCLPMIVQIPVFIALYNVLLNSIELRHAPFYLWINDLSVHDPYYITPIIMGASMFLQQKMNPSQSSMDPNMAKMMMLMPIVFTFIFLNFPAGLVIYWLVNNVLSIFQQYMINRSK